MNSQRKELILELLFGFQVRKLLLKISGSKKWFSIENWIFLVSAIADIGSASFKYDMRRLTEILAFPKAWYRRSIVRRLFLGDFTSSSAYSDTDGVGPLNQEEAVMGSSLTSRYYDRLGSESISKSVPEKSPTFNRDKLRLSLESDLPKTKLKGYLFD